MTKQEVRQQLAIIAAITEARRQTNLSKRALSERLGESLNFMQKVESGDRAITVMDFIKIARALGVNPCELLDRSLRD